MNRTIWVFAIVATIAFASVDALACTCSLPWTKRTIEEQVEKARNDSRAVFSGNVLKIEEAGYMLKVTLSVDKSWKGKLPSEVVLLTGRGGGDCGYRFAAGDSCLVYAYGSDVNHLGTNVCQRTMPLSSGDGDLKVLRQDDAEKSAPSFNQDLSWSPDNKKISFSASSGSDYSIYIARSDGSSVRKINDSKGDLWSAWSPDGKKIAFTSKRDGNADIYVMRPDESQISKLTSGPGKNQAPSWSPDGSKIAFMSNRDGKWRIYVMKADGSNPVRITNNDTDDHNPSWSPKGGKILFYSGNGKGKDQIYVINADGKNQTKLTDNEFNNIYASWSRDSKKIIFCSNRDGSNAIFTMKADGSEQRKLIDKTAFFARWSPDGRRIAFIAGQYPSTEIYIMNADGTDMLRLMK